MACYTAWNHYLTPGSSLYKKEKKRLKNTLSAVRHIIDYYYRTADFPLPNFPIDSDFDWKRQPRSRKEKQIRDSICHHFLCDSISFIELYDAATLLNLQISEDRQYLSVICGCGFLLEHEGRRFEPQLLQESKGPES